MTPDIFQDLEDRAHVIPGHMDRIGELLDATIRHSEHADPGPPTPP